MQDMLACFYCSRRYPRSAASCARCKKPLPRSVQGRFYFQHALAANPETITYRAMDESEHAPRLIRVLRATATQSGKMRLETEARIQQSLTGTDLCPEFITAAEFNAFRTFCTVATFVEGITFSDVVRRATPSRIMDLFLLVLDSVERFQRENLVICNLDSNHIRLTNEGEMRLVDLRCARKPGALSHGLGKNGSKAPEQFADNEPVSKGTDVFALGSILYTALTRRAPYARWWSSVPDFSQPLVPASKRNRLVTPGLDTLITKALEIEPMRRFSDVAAMRDAFWREFAGRTQVIVQPKRSWFAAL